MDPRAQKINSGSGAHKNAALEPRAQKIRLRIPGPKKCGSGSVTLKKTVTLLHVVLHSADESASVGPVDVQHNGRDVDENQDQTKTRYLCL